MHIDVYAPISKAAKPYGPIARHLSFLHSGRLFRVSSTYLSHTRQPRTLLKRGKRPRHSEAGKLTRPSFICMSSQADQPTSAPICLTIAGSDSGGGAGIQADLKTFSALGVFGTSAITALTSQNTQGVNAIHNAPEEFVTKQICSVLDDMNVSVVKIGMLPNAKVVKAVAECLSKRTQQGLQVVLDPVLISTSGHSLAESDVSKAIFQELFPLATIVTPNLAEAGALLGESNVASLKDMKEAAKKLQKVGPNAVLVKGGHLGEIESASRPKGEEELIDVLCVNGDIEMISGPKIATKNTHGTGCTTASAISAFLARRNTIRESVKNARNYVTNALAYSSHLQIGQGPQRPFNHSYEVDDWQNRRKDIDLRLYAVTDPDCNIKRNRSNSESVQLALEGGTTCVQLREKSADGARFCEEAQKVLQACRTHGVRLVINDRVDVALAVGADGVHVGQDDIPAKLARKLIGPGKILGVSVKTVDQAIKAEQDGADYLGSGAMFETATKSSSTISFETLKEICESVKIPVVAIGGIKKEHVKRCLEMGCKGVAVVSAIFASEDACKATQEIRSEIDAYHGR